MPEGTAIIVALFIAGFLLIAAEVFVPGAVLGIAGFLCLAGSVGVVFLHHGALAGTVAAFVVGALSLTGFFVWLSIFPRTFIGRRIVLGTTQPAPVSDWAGLAGQEGVALTPLRPSGTVRVGDRRVSAVAEAGEFVAEGAAVSVVSCGGMGVVVRPKDRLEPRPDRA